MPCASGAAPGTEAGATPRRRRRPSEPRRGPLVTTEYDQTNKPKLNDIAFILSLVFAVESDEH